MTNVSPHIDFVVNRKYSLLSSIIKFKKMYQILLCHDKWCKLCDIFISKHCLEQRQYTISKKYNFFLELVAYRPINLSYGMRLSECRAFMDCYSLCFSLINFFISSNLPYYHNVRIQRSYWNSFTNGKLLIGGGYAFEVPRLLPRWPEFSLM